MHQTLDACYRLNKKDMMPLNQLLGNFRLLSSFQKYLLKHNSLLSCLVELLIF